MVKIIVLTSHKGGIGKTTATVNIAFAAKENNKRVAVVDLDTQGHSTTVLSQNAQLKRQEEGGAQSLFEDSKLSFLSTQAGIDLLPGNQFLDRLDMEDQEKLLNLAIEKRDIIKALPYDYLIFDTPPSSIRQSLPLVWADLAVIPVEPAPLAVEGLADIRDMIEEFQFINPNLKRRLFLNRYMPRSKSQQELVKWLEMTFSGEILAKFSSRVAVTDSLAESVPVWQYSRTSKELAKAWLDFGNLVLKVASTRGKK